MTPRKPYQKPALKFGEVLARKTNAGIMYGVKTFEMKDIWLIFYTVIQAT